MVAIAPFRALRYNPDVVGDLSPLIAPPYDVISPEEQEQLYERSSHNVVRLIYGKQFPTDTPSENRYTRAKQTFDDWRRTRVLVQDATPACYLYEHTFTWAGQRLRRLGLVALLQFEGSVPGQVFGHEATFAAPKADRTQLLEAVRANLSPIFCILADGQRRLLPLLRELSQRATRLATASLNGEQHHLWAITDAQTIRRLQASVAPVSALIADGHHRFEVAWSQRHRCGAVMTYFACAEDPAVVVRPIHRVVRMTEGADAQWRARLETLCRLTPVGSLEALIRWLSTTQDQGQFGYYEDGRYYQVAVNPTILADWLVRPSVPLALAGLDVTILHEGLLPKLLGQPFDAARLVRYTAEPSHAIAMIDQHEGDCAWVLRGILLAQAFALASQGLTLPQKSTYFYPKVFSGLLTNPWE